MDGRTKILLVDDDPATRSLPALFLNKWGYDVVEAADGQEALNILEHTPIGLVISDWVMPNLTGIELCRKVREGRADRYVYLILCTSKAERSDFIEGMEAGADDFLVKPFSKEEMRVRVRAGERIVALERGLIERNRLLASTNERLAAAYQRIERDLQAAAWVQSNLLPLPSPRPHNIISEWRFHPSNYLAGDTFNVFPIDDRRVGFYLLDVAGHGVPAAMLSVTLSMVLSPDSPRGSPIKRFNPQIGDDEVVSPADVVEDLNQRFQAKDDRYFTMIYGILDSRSGEISLTQAGHPYPILIPYGGEPVMLGEGGPPVGLWPGMKYETTRARLCPGDRLLVYSDGVVECANPEGVLFGAEQLLAYLREARRQPLEVMLAGIEAAMEQWRGNQQFDDDVSLLALELPRTPEHQ